MVAVKAGRRVEDFGDFDAAKNKGSGSDGCSCSWNPNFLTSHQPSTSSHPLAPTLPTLIGS